jgi:tetrapyrrole methylase family protein / MazG family protein
VERLLGWDFVGMVMATRKNKVQKTKSKALKAKTRGAGGLDAKRHDAVGRKSAKPAALSAGEWFEKLAAVQARLRAPDGCPWDREQTHASLRTYLIEEAYEVLEAMESGDDAKFAEEMGDLLLQIVFHSEIAREEGRFVVSDVIREVHDKMVRRHPHVFGEKRAKDSAEVLKNWEQIKKEERIAAGKKAGEESKGEKKTASLLDGVSKALPAALEGFQLTRRAARIGFDWDSVEGVIDKVKEETGELREAVGAKDAELVEEEMGDLLFAAVNVARFLHVDPEIALKKANAKFSARFRQMEKLAAERGKTLADVPREEMEGFWEEVKKVASGE